ncbi:signal recognition particle protein [Parasporobacterium paucivorans]|uniref:Signal recognition particle protein n=1 Tax=Parasporobacterium paucivorans DSM 15970 TaxID=1122934 RepID=A0A1M5ZZK5_9FIRM|nr:signal recognition particle protein [Parasporobacterium paucivorans]SHI29652.1 signal recognition particle subunit FFH/SRP54 (srp54) [Parasporobacterium paucivorans DSM 15970]
MAFESLSDKLQNIFKNLKSKGRLTETDVKNALKEVKMALLEADVNFKVVKNFVNTVTERAVGTDVLNSLTPGQMVIKIVNEEMVSLMGSEKEELKLRPSNELTIIMMAGLQGAGKTTTAAKLAGKFAAKGRKPLLAACDVYRPAAIEQLKVNGEKLGIPVFSMGSSQKPVDIAKAAVEHAKKNGNNVLIIDTAGRLHIDESMMEELVEVKKNVDVYKTVLVVDAMTGQDAVNVATTFDERIGIDGVILTKLDGDTRGGAALSIRAVTSKPILFGGMGEKLSDLEEFYPDRMASRILGMGDILSLIEKAEASVDMDQAKDLEKRFKKADFGFDDYLVYMQQIKNMGGLADIMSMIPGMGSKMKDAPMPDEKSLGRIEGIIYSMTLEERANPNIINPSRKIRIAKGAGVDISEVNRLIKQFEQARKLMKQMPGMMKGGKKGMFGMGSKFKMPF